MRVTKKIFGKVGFKVLASIFLITAITLSFTQLSCKSKGEKVIKIGAILPLTGPAASFGQYVKEGIELAIEEINKESQSKFHIIYEDSKNQPKEAISAYNKMVSLEKAPVIIAALSSVASALSPLAYKTKTVQVYVDVAKPGVADGSYTFRMYPEANGTAGKIADFCSAYLKAKRAAVIHINDAYGEASLSVFRRRFESEGGMVVFEETYDLFQKDFKDIIARLKKVEPKPDVIYLNGYGPAFVKAVRQLYEMHVNIQLIADVALGLPDNLQQAVTAAEGAYFVDGIMSPGFVDKFKQRYNKEPSSDAGYAYDVIMILAKIAKESPTWSSEYIREGLRNLKDFPGVMGKITMQPNGNAKLQFVIKQILKGKPVVVEYYR